MFRSFTSVIVIIWLTTYGIAQAAIKYAPTSDMPLTVGTDLRYFIDAAADKDLTTITSENIPWQTIEKARPTLASLHMFFGLNCR